MKNAQHLNKRMLSFPPLRPLDFPVNMSNLSRLKWYIIMYAQNTLNIMQQPVPQKSIMVILSNYLG